jgi:hypothetical protein
MENNLAEIDVATLRPRDAARRLKAIGKDPRATREEFKRQVDALWGCVECAHSDVAGKAMTLKAIDMMDDIIAALDAVEHRVGDLEDRAAEAATVTAH